jgi:starch-binding outer membrane protein, SusD/RagB family
MKIHTYIISKFLICVIIIVFVSGCTKFLDEQDKSNFTSDNYFTNATQAETSVNSAYSGIEAIYSGNYGFAGGLAPWLMLEFATGYANTELGEAVENRWVRTLTNTSDNQEGKVWWDQSYKGIANANLSITRIPDVVMDEAKKAKLLGQARFLRAFYYYNLVRIFGNIPLITSPVDLNSPDMYPSQASPEEVYNVIVEDLKVAEASGLPYLDATGRVSMGVVKSLLASVYLTMAGYPLQKGNEYYQLAADKAAEVIESNNYSLFTLYDDLHKPANKNKGENIFQAQYTALIYPSYWQSAIVPYNKGISVYDGQGGAIFSELPFVNSYEIGDKRAVEKQFFYKYYTLASDRTDTIDLGNTYIYKLFDVVANESTASSGLNWTLMRYAELLLIYAEASNEVSGPTADSYEAVNQIRRRAELPELSGLSKDEFRDAIFRESCHELSFEDKTWFNMARTRKAYNLTTGNIEDLLGYEFVSGAVYAEKDLLFPIPTSEMNSNPNLDQNTGY